MPKSTALSNGVSFSTTRDRSSKLALPTLVAVVVDAGATTAACAGVDVGDAVGKGVTASVADGAEDEPVLDAWQF